MRPALAVLCVAASLCLLAIGWSALRLADSTEAARQDLRAAQAALTATAEAARVDLAATERALVAEVREVRQVAALRLREALGEVRAARVDLRDQLAAANASVSGIRADARPVLDAAAQAVVPYGTLGAQATRLAMTVRESHDDLYWDFKAAVESATVAGRGIAEASEAVGKAAPEISTAIQATVTHTAKVTGEAARVAPQVADDVAGTARNARKLSGWPMRVLKVANEARCFVPGLNLIPGC